MIYNLLDDQITNWMLKSKFWKYNLQFKQKRKNNKQDSAYIKHREEWKRRNEEEQTRETEGAKRENNRKGEKQRRSRRQERKEGRSSALRVPPAETRLTVHRRLWVSIFSGLHQKFSSNFQFSHGKVFSNFIKDHFYDDLWCQGYRNMIWDWIMLREIMKIMKK